MRPMGIARPFAPAVLAAVVGLVAACDGPNQFSTPIATTGRAPTVEIKTPKGDAQSAKPIGDSVLVRARVRDDEGVDSVVFQGLAFRGDPALGTDEIVPRFQPKKVILASVRDTTLSRYLAPTSVVDKETASIIVAAWDGEGNASADTVPLILGGPDVKILNLVDEQAVKAGLGLNLSAVADDPLGIVEIRFELAGAFDTTLVVPVLPAADSVGADTTVALPAGASGSLEIAASARNVEGVVGRDALTVQVVTGGPGDDTPPTVELHVSALPQLELQDSLFVQVSGHDDPQGSGIARIGFTVQAISATRGDTMIRSGEVVYTPPRTGTVANEFVLPVFNVDSLSLPDTIVYEAVGYLVDASGNCAAAVEDGVEQSLDCASLLGGQTVAEGRTGEQLVRPHVSGRTVQLPNGGEIMDAAVDTLRRNLFLSNIQTNQLEVFRMESETFGEPIGVGSEPWGLALTRNGDSLWVANSGGTNLSVVDLNSENEVDNDRFLTPDVVLFDIELEQNETGIVYRVFVLPSGENPSFSDRPQFMAVDSFGNLVYSTKSSLIGNIGTARKAFFLEGTERSEVKLFVEHGLMNPSDNFWAVAHVDSVGSSIDTVGFNGGQPILAAALTLFDHVPGFPDQTIIGRAATALGETPTAAWLELVTQGSDAYMVEGARWIVPSLGFQDTTYVAGSGDGGWIAVGEGSAAPVGRVLMYEATEGGSTALSGVIPVTDLLTNPSEEVRGLGMNYDGTLGVVRGREAAYFINPDLRLQGLTEIPLATIGSGAALHPLHANFRTLDNQTGEYRPDTHLAFVGTGDRTIDIIDTQRYKRIGRVAIRDIVTGPLRAVLPFPQDNAQLQCSTVPVTDKRGNLIGNAVQLYQGNDFNAPIPPDGITDDACVVVKLFATTSAGGVVVIDVRKADILREHPARR